MIFNPYQEICRGYLDAEISKIRLLNTKEIPDYLKALCNDLIENLESQFNKIYDEIDLRAFRSALTVVEDFNELLSNISTLTNNNWIVPLIKNCYRNAGISLIDRNIVVVNSPESIGFAVIPDFLSFATSLYPSIKTKNYKRFDVFIVPYEIKFDISSICIIAHEVGHVFLNDKYSTIASDIINTEYDKYIQLNAKGDIELTANLIKRKEAVSSYIQEFFCDDYGRYLLGPAFDFALCKLFCFSHVEDQIKTKSHPSTKLRIKKSIESLSQYEEIGYEVNENVKVLKNYFKDIALSSEPDDKEDEFCQRINSILTAKFSIETIIKARVLNNYWRKVRVELDAFRPPFESFTDNKRELITPIEILLCSTIYYYSKAYMNGNEFYRESSETAEVKFYKLREKLIEHIQYAINLYDFLKHSELKLNEKEFEFSSLKNTLWDLRSKTFKKQPSPFIITPNIDPRVQYSSSSVDLRLGQTFLVNKLSKYTHIDPVGKSEFDTHGDLSSTPIEEYYDKYVMPIGSKFTLHPHQFVLAQTLEYICIPGDSYALVLGRSSWGRLGLNIATATAVGAGFRGCITLELRNLGETPLPLNVGLRICQISLIPITQFDNYELYFTSQSKYIGPVSSEIPKIRDDADWDLLNSFRL